MKLILKDEEKNSDLERRTGLNAAAAFMAVAMRRQFCIAGL